MTPEHHYVLQTHIKMLFLLQFNSIFYTARIYTCIMVLLFLHWSKIIHFVYSCSVCIFTKISNHNGIFIITAIVFKYLNKELSPQESLVVTQLCNTCSTRMLIQILTGPSISPMGNVKAQVSHLVFTRRHPLLDTRGWDLLWCWKYFIQH